MTLTSRGKILITGSGRAGTTFLVQLLTRLGMDTGFEPYNEPYFDNVRAGCEVAMPIDIYNASETEIREKISGAARVLKSCEWGIVLKQFLEASIVEVDHVLIPIRDFESAARSRLSVGLDWLIGNRKEEERLEYQTSVCAIATGKAIEACTLYDIPFTTLAFPKLAQSEDYCFWKLKNLGEDFNRHRFSRIFRELSFYHREEKESDKVFRELYVS